VPGRGVSTIGDGADGACGFVQAAAMAAAATATPVAKMAEVDLQWGTTPPRYPVGLDVSRQRVTVVPRRGRSEPRRPVTLLRVGAPRQ